MPVAQEHHPTTYTVPALFAALITSGVTQMAFMADLHLGALYRPELGRILPLLLFSPVLVIPALIFAVFVVWPTTLFLAFVAGTIANWTPRRCRWSIWLASGAIGGMAALYGYSFLLDLGQARIGHLLINGAICGVGCAALVLRFHGPDVDDGAAGADLEGADRGF